MGRLRLKEIKKMTKNELIEYFLEYIPNIERENIQMRKLSRKMINFYFDFDKILKKHDVVDNVVELSWVFSPYGSDYGMKQNIEQLKQAIVKKKGYSYYATGWK